MHRMYRLLVLLTLLALTFSGLGIQPASAAAPSSYVSNNVRFDPISYTVTFDANDGSGLTMTQTEFSATELWFNTFLRDGYGFAGWSLTPTGAVVYADGAIYNFQADITLYAKWIPPHIVTFDANDGSGLTTTQMQNEPTALTPNTFYRDGYLFAGWSLTPAGAVAYADGAIYNFQADITLYAKWTPPHTVTFDANDGSGITATQTEFFATELLFNAFFRDGYGFAGWSLTPAGAVAYADGAIYNFQADITLYAKWTPPHTVTFDANDGSGVTMTQTENTPTALLLNPFYRDGYGFSGWSLTPAGAVAYADGATYNFQADVTLYAKWTLPHTVTFDANDGSGLTATQTENTPTALMPNTFSRDGYLFVGWSLTPTGKVTYAEGATYDFQADLTLYAKWRPPHTVTFDANDGSGLTATQTEFSATELWFNTFYRDGYLFAGWSLTPTGAVAYADGAIYNFGADITLYAKWTPPHVVTFNANDGSGLTVTQSEFTPVELMFNTFYRDGYLFAGWSLTPTGALAYDDGAIYDFMADITLYAKWIDLCNPTVTNNGDDGAGSLRQALVDACVDGTITFDGNYTITLASTLILTQNVTIDGTGHTVNISGGNAVQVFSIFDGTSVTMKSLTVKNGSDEFMNGGGIVNFGMLTVMNSTFSGNSAASGGGIANYNTLTVANSTFSGNSATSNGGGIANLGTLTVTNSTFSGNTATSNGGGIFNDEFGVLNLKNNILANSTAGGDCYNFAGGVIDANVNNLIETNSDCGVPASTADPKLAALAVNSGTTQTFALLAGSPALGAGHSSVCAAAPINNLDQRGQVRPQGDVKCDIGAYESSLLAGRTVTFNANGGSGTMTPQVANAPTTLKLNTFTHTGYTFAGWSATAAGAVAYTNGATYNFSADITLYAKWTALPKTATFKSIATQDGWTLESSENSSVGGSFNSAATTFNLGDTVTKSQYRGILSFDTGATLPDSAVITKVTLKVKQQSIIGGGNPVTTFQGFMVDIKNGFFGVANTLNAGDFNAAASKTVGPFVITPVSTWYSIDLTAGKASINKLASNGGLTQIRLRFKLDDNNNAIANYLSLLTGNAPAASQPQLIVEYIP